MMSEEIVYVIRHLPCNTAVTWFELWPVQELFMSAELELILSMLYVTQKIKNILISFYF